MNSDKERLDWLEKFHTVIILEDGRPTEWKRTHKLTANQACLREAIDAAIETPLEEAEMSKQAALNAKVEWELGTSGD